MRNTINEAVMKATGKSLPAAVVFVWQIAFVVWAEDAEGVCIFGARAIDDTAYRAGINSHGVGV